ncbi:MAG: M20/M25/M40 family metallo-hydrolase [Candidatus Sumerlaeota bacterium]
MDLKENVLKILEECCTIPTAPFREGAVAQYIKDFADQHRLEREEDAMGNLILRYGAEHSDAPLVFAAHMDHPGFLIEKAVGVGGGQTTARFYGGVGDRYFDNARVRVVREGRLGAHGKVLETGKRGKGGYRAIAVELDGPAEKGDMAVWDLPHYRRRGDRFYSRVCDDLGGCALILAMLAEVRRRGLKCPVCGLFTVAEEAGFHGAFQVCREGFVGKSSRVVSVETSSELAGPKRGDGVVVRVGDRQSIFDPAMTKLLLEAGARMKSGGHEECGFQRALMDGGACEGTAYQWHGYPTGALALPLGNYHNQNVRRGKIGMESISVSDMESAVRLMVEAVKLNSKYDAYMDASPPTYTEKRGALGEWMLFPARKKRD